MKHVDKLFKEKLYNHEVVVPEGMWEKIAPIAEEESGRAILWFWFAGILALLLGGFGIYKMVNASITNPTDPGTLVYNDIETPEPKTNFALTNNFDQSNDIQQEQSDSKAEYTYTDANTEETELVNTIAKNTKPKIKDIPTTKTKPFKSASPNISTAPPVVKEQDIQNTVESISNVGGTPVSLVITKSYINKEGSVIKQSNLTEESGNEEPVFDIIINSQTKELNAGALLRIIEPLENIPLPAFQKQLKKKTQNIVL